MNALVALCHFCELHGPRTLFCTEAVHPPSPSPPQPGPAIPGDRDREADREGEGLTMRANSSATQRADMCEVSEKVTLSYPKFIFKSKIRRKKNYIMSYLISVFLSSQGLSLLTCVSPRLCECGQWDGNPLSEPPTPTSATALQCRATSMCAQPELRGMYTFMFASIN